jgi:hypothetical protein
MGAIDCAPGKAIAPMGRSCAKRERSVPGMWPHAA